MDDLDRFVPNVHFEKIPIQSAILRSVILSSGAKTFQPYTGIPFSHLYFFITFSSMNRGIKNTEESLSACASEKESSSLRSSRVYCLSGSNVL